MTLNKIFENIIKEHCNNTPILNDIKGVKVLDCKFVECVQTKFPQRGNPMLTKYHVFCSMKAKKFENNRVQFSILLYSDGSEITCYFDKTYYEK